MNHLLNDLLGKLLGKRKSDVARLLGRSSVVWKGNHASWAEAMALSSGYDKDAILKKTLASVLKVKNGEAAYERDSVVFGQIEYSWPLLAGILLAAAGGEGSLGVLDFGGSLGTTYFQNRKFLSRLPDVRWLVVEQPHFVEAGRRHVADGTLLFFNSIEEALSGHRARVALLSTVLAYVEHPHALLEEIIALELDYVIVDATAFLHRGTADRLTVQRVSPRIYEASYPAWFFNKPQFLRHFEGKYALVEEFSSHIGRDLRVDGRVVGSNLGFIFAREGAGLRNG